jgi:hypothetical protein
MASDGFVYTTVPGKIKPLLDKIADVGVPSKVTQTWMAGIGFTSSNDRTLLNVLRQIEFIDSADAPTRLWEEFRAGRRTALGQGIHEGYAQVYEVYADAESRSPQELTNVFKSIAPKLGMETVGKILSTFRALVALAEFADGKIIDVPFRPMPINPGTGASLEQVRSEGRLSPGAKIGVSSSPVKVSIHIQLPVTDDAEVYERIFSAMRTHLIAEHD